MRILSIKHHLSADHSSSTYHFIAADKLTAEERKFVGDLTGKQPRGRGLNFHYFGDWHDIPWEWTKKLLSGPYDVMVGESYDHWQAELTLPYDKALHDRILHYECPSDEDGFEVDRLQKRTHCMINFHVDYGADFFDYDEDAVKQIAELFVDIRDDILGGDLSALRVIYEMYGAAHDDQGRRETADDKGPLSENTVSLKSFLMKL
jgi:hypothetical protein